MCSCTREQASEGSASGDLGGPGAGAYVRYEAHRFIEGLALRFALLGIGDLACLAHLLKRLRWRPIEQASRRDEGSSEGTPAGAHLFEDLLLVLTH